MANWLDEFFTSAAGAFTFYEDGTARPTRRKLNFIGATVTDDTVNERLDIEITGYAISAALPQALGTANAGATGEASDAGHVHAHGNLAGGSLHADVIAAGASGFMTGADKTKLDGLVASSSTPEPIGVAAIGVGTTWARADHVHAHGVQGGGSEHADATQLASGFMSGADKTILDGADANDTPSTLCARDSSGDCAFVGVACATLEATSYVETPLVANSAGVLEVQGASGVLVSHGVNDLVLAEKYSTNVARLTSQQDILMLRNAQSSGQLIMKVESATGAAIYDAPIVGYRDSAGSYDYLALLQKTSGLPGLSGAFPGTGAQLFQDIDTGAPRGQIRVTSSYGVYSEVSVRDNDGAGGVVKAAYDRIARLSSSTSSLTQDKTLLAAADLPSGTPEWVARVEVEWWAYDTTDNTIAGGTRRATVKSVGGTISVVTSAANQVIGSDDNETAGSVSGGSAVFLRSGGTTVDIRFATLKTNAIKFGARVRAFLVEH